MRRLLTAILVSAALAAPLPLATSAQAATIISVLVVSACGTPGSTYTTGTYRTPTMDTTGTLCSQSGGGGGGGGTSSNFGAAFPAAGTAVGFLNSAGTLMSPGNLDASGNLRVILGTGATTVVTQPTAANLNATVIGTGTFAVQLTGATNNINNIAGTISLPTGAATAANQATEIASLATIATNSGSSIPAGTALIGKVGIDQTTLGSTNGVSVVAATTGGLTPFTLTAANSTNATNIKASAGLVDHISVYNNSATLAWVSFYDSASAPTCGTGIKYQVMIPANSTSGAGAVENFFIGVGHTSGIGICVTTGIAGTGSVAASSYVVNVFYK